MNLHMSDNAWLGWCGSIQASAMDGPRLDYGWGFKAYAAVQNTKS